LLHDIAVLQQYDTQIRERVGCHDDLWQQKKQCPQECANHLRNAQTMLQA
jgi:hypothetical protein